MKSYRIVSLMLLCVLIGAVLANVVTTPTANAQPEATASAPRFQISAYSSTLGNNVVHGAYVIDEMTGKTWHVRQAGSQQVIVQKLP